MKRDMFNWKDYLVLAEELALCSQDEAKRRSAVSRAYYAVFCAARKYINMEDYAGPDVHRAVIREYNKSPNKDERMVGFKLDIARKYRAAADYRDWETIDVSSMEDSIARAKQIFDIIKQNPPSPHL